jgi:ribulose-phosphate 3-epimerase
MHLAQRPSFGKVFALVSRPTFATMAIILAPSLLAANLAELGKAVDMLDGSEAQWVHLDVMDGVFVPNISYGLPVIKSLRPRTKKVFDVHLMIVDPDRYINAFRDAGADLLTVHMEACTHLHRTLQAIRATGMRAGVALNPHTPVGALEEVIAEADLVCLMGVNPGFGGQHFIPATLGKLAKLRSLKEQYGPQALLEVDGGVSAENVAHLAAAGADVLVAGNAVFSTSDPEATIRDLLALGKP